MTNRLAAVAGVILGLVLPSTGWAGPVVLSEDFEGYLVGSNLVGQGGWFQPNPAATDPMLIATGTGLPSQVAEGHIMAGSNQSQVSRALSGPLNSSDISTLVVDAYAFESGPQTHNSEVRLESSAGTFFIRWQAAAFAGPQRWRFIVKGQPIEDVVGFFGEVVRLEIVIDGIAGEVYGRLGHSGGTVETSHSTITASEIISLDRVELFADYRDAVSYLGGEYDNITVTTLPVELQSFSIE